MQESDKEIEMDIKQNGGLIDEAVAGLKATQKSVGNFFRRKFNFNTPTNLKDGIKLLTENTRRSLYKLLLDVSGAKSAGLLSGTKRAKRRLEEFKKFIDKGNENGSPEVINFNLLMFGQKKLMRILLGMLYVYLTQAALADEDLNNFGTQLKTLVSPDSLTNTTKYNKGTPESKQRKQDKRATDFAARKIIQGYILKDRSDLKSLKSIIVELYRLLVIGLAEDMTSMERVYEEKTAKSQKQIEEDQKAIAAARLKSQSLSGVSTKDALLKAELNKVIQEMRNRFNLINDNYRNAHNQFKELQKYEDPTNEKAIKFTKQLIQDIETEIIQKATELQQYMEGPLVNRLYSEAKAEDIVKGLNFAYEIDKSIESLHFIDLLRRDGESSPKAKLDNYLNAIINSMKAMIKQLQAKYFANVFISPHVYGLTEAQKNKLTDPDTGTNPNRCPFTDAEMLNLDNALQKSEGSNLSDDETSALNEFLDTDDICKIIKVLCTLNYGQVKQLYKIYKQYYIKKIVAIITVEINDKGLVFDDNKPLSCSSIIGKLYYFFKDSLSNSYKNYDTFVKYSKRFTQYLMRINRDDRLGRLDIDVHRYSPPRRPTPRRPTRRSTRTLPASTNNSDSEYTHGPPPPPRPTRTLPASTTNSDSASITNSDSASTTNSDSASTTNSDTDPKYTNGPPPPPTTPTRRPSASQPEIQFAALISARTIGSQTSLMRQHLNNAQTQAYNAQNAADNAQHAAGYAQKLAEFAKDNARKEAEKAQDAAAEGRRVAAVAQGTAANAQRFAKDALKQAGIVRSTANELLKNQSLQDKVQKTASEAQGAAAEVQKTASEAQGVAANAQRVAEEAQRVAEEAQRVASEAQRVAEEARLRQQQEALRQQREALRQQREQEAQRVASEAQRVAEEALRQQREALRQQQQGQQQGRQQQGQQIPLSLPLLPLLVSGSALSSAAAPGGLGGKARAAAEEETEEETEERSAAGAAEQKKPPGQNHANQALELIADMNQNAFSNPNSNLNGGSRHYTRKRHHRLSGKNHKRTLKRLNKKHKTHKHKPSHRKRTHTRK